MDIEQKIDKLEQELNWLKEQAKNCKPKYWKPKNGEKSWYIYGGILQSDNSWASKAYKRFIAIGDIFKTREEAERELELRLATQRLKEAIWEANGGAFIWFNENSKNFSIEVHQNTLLVTEARLVQVHQNWMYVKDEETAEIVLEENRRDFEIYYGLN